MTRSIDPHNDPSDRYDPAQDDLAGHNHPYTGGFFGNCPGCRRPARRSVLQDWVMELPLREQGTLLTAVRGCDEEPKIWGPDGVVVDTPARRLTAFIRWCFMNPADPREVDIPGAFFQSTPPAPFHASAFGHLPQHWYAHVMHALEVIAYRHPDGPTQFQAMGLYLAMVHNLHLRPEELEQMVDRLSEDRIASGTVVS